MSGYRDTDPSYEEPVLTPNTVTVLRDRYLIKNEKGEVVESPKDMFYRVAACVADADKLYGEDTTATRKKFYDLMAKGLFMPNSPALMNAGLENGNLFGACIHGDAPVLTSTGYVPMKDVVLRHQQGIYQEVSNGLGKWVPVLAAVSKGIKPVYRNYAGPSRSVDSTLDHRFSTFVPGEKIGGEYVKGSYKWEEVGNIPLGNKLRFGEQGAQEFVADEVDSEVAIAAWILTDGGCGVYPQSKGSSTFFVAEIQVIDDLSLANAKYHLNKLGISFTESDEEGVHNVERFTRLRSYDRNLEKLCEKFGLFSRKASKALSPLVEGSSYSSKVELLRIMFEADGSISSTGLEYASVSKELAYSVSGLLDLVGVGNNVYFRKENRSGRLDGWRVCINHTDSILSFASRVGFLSARKTEKLSSWPEKEAGPSRIKLVSREYLGDYEVFDIQTAPDGDGSFVVDGILVHNCFVLPVEDSIDGIFDTVKATAQVQKAGGGTGFSFDRLRPTGDFIKSSGGTTSGPISFWRVLYETTNAIQQGSKRRGANMGMMTITHPDILKFITAKQDLNAFTNYNISVKITDEWMAEYKADPDSIHVVKNFRSGAKYLIPKSSEIKKCEVKDLIPYTSGMPVEVPVWTKREVFAIIIDCAWRTGEPGLFFIDEANRYNPTPHIGDYESTNPCVVGETPILTDKGYARIDSLVGKAVKIWNGQEWSEVTPEVTGANQDILLVKLSDGSEHKVTKYHKYPIMTTTDTRRPNEVRYEAKDLVPGMRLMPFEYPTIEGADSIDATLAYTKGFFSGDGSTQSARDVDSLWLYGEKKNLLNRFIYRTANECAGDRIHVGLDNSIDWNKTFVPSAAWSVQSRLSWLSGLIDSDGSVMADGGVQIWSVNKEFLKEVKRMLFITGAGSSLLLGKEETHKLMPDGKGGQKEYFCQESWRLCIPLWAVALLRDAGMETHRVDISKEATYKTNAIKVVSVETCGVAETVYCFNEPKNHTGTFDCAVLCNCGEQVLLPYESCNLGSIDLSKCVAGGVFNWEKFGSIIKDSVHFLDNVVDASPYPIQQIADMCHNNRKIGLGVMGFADTLFRLGISYNSEEGIAFGRAVMKFLNDKSLDASEALAGTRGVFPNWRGSRWELEWGNRKLRNAVATTVAPTGTISIIADCSGGIEPLFSIAFERFVLGGKTLVQVDKFFESIAKERGFYSAGLMERIAREGSVAHIDEVPDDVKRVFVSAHDITPEWHIRMQAAFQENCGSSISKTINMLSTATRDDVEKAYLQAWDLKCKGITVYRDGCRSLQPMTLKKDAPAPMAPAVSEPPKKRGVEDYKPRKPVKTLPILPAVRIRQNTPFGHMHVTISVDTSTRKEVEIFAQLGKAGDVCSSDLEAICRMVSMYLRIGGSMLDVIKQLEGIGSHMSVATKDGSVKSLADGLGKSMKIYHLAKSMHGLDALLLGQIDISKISLRGEGSLQVVDKMVAASPSPVSKSEANQAAYKVKCTECGGVLTFQEGCVKCPSCGLSKCS